MKTNSTIVGIVFCVVCCVGTLLLIPSFTSSEYEEGWSPADLYNGEIANVEGAPFTNATLSISNDNGSLALSSTKRSNSKLFHHTRSSIRFDHIYSQSPMRASYAMRSSMSASSSPISYVGTRSSNAAGYSMNASSNIYTTSSSSSSLVVSSTSQTSTNGGSMSGARTGMEASAYKGAMAGYANYASSNLTSLSKHYMSPTIGTNGMMRAAPVVGNYSEWFDAWLDEIATNQDTDRGWLYGGGEDGKEYFSEAGLQVAFEDFLAWLESQNGGILPSVGAAPTWEQFWEWFTNYGDTDSFNDDGMNEFYRLPLSNDISLLVLFALMNAIVIFIRTKKAYRRTL